jgi:hypothetical protein
MIALGTTRQPAAWQQLSSAAAAIGYHKRAPAIDQLQSVLQNPQPVKLRPWSTPVSAALPAQLSLLRLGTAGSQGAILDVIAQDDLSDQVFMLEVLDQIEDQKILLQLSKHLEDQRAIAGGVPTGAVPQRRLCDLALEAFAERFDLTLAFDLNTTRRYLPERMSPSRGCCAAASVTGLSRPAWLATNRADSGQ